MTKILTISKNAGFAQNISSFLNEYNFENSYYIYQSDDETLKYIKENGFCAVLIDDEIETYSVLSKRIKNIENENIFIAIFYNENSIVLSNEDFTGFVDTFIQKPVNKNIFIPIINSYLKIKKSVDKFKEDNKGLNKSLYQLDVLYNTSSKLSGILDKNMLYEIMFETLEKTLSFDLACALIYPNKTGANTRENKLFIHSLKKPDETLLNVLKEKIVQYAKENNGTDTDFSNISTEEFIKPSYENQNFDIKLLNSDKLIAPIKVKDETFGVISIYRNKQFSKEDVVCFQSIMHQIAVPFRIINLYDEKNLNIEALKKLERIKTEFVSIVSHELRTPLVPINLSLDFLSTESTSESAKKAVDMAKKNVTRLTGMIEDLLDLSRIETGKFNFVYKKYNVKTSLDLAQKTYEEFARKKNIDFSMIQEENLPEIYADQRKIDQILTNIINNAIKFTPNGGKITVEAKIADTNEIDNKVLIDPIEALQKHPRGQYIHILIKDTGLGIKEEDIHKIFNKFSQIENSLTRNAGGIGLGLTLTKNFIDAHLGGIWVESKENEGSAFNVIIPVYSESKAFEIDLNASKKTNDTTCLLTFKGKEEDVLSLVQKLKEQNIIKQVKNSKEAGFKGPETRDGSFIYKIYFSNLQKNVCDFTINQIQTFIDNSFFKDCGIVLERAFYKKEEGYYSPGI